MDTELLQYQLFNTFHMLSCCKNTSGFIFCQMLLPPVYEVRREGNVFSLSVCLSVHRWERGTPVPGSRSLPSVVPSPFWGEGVPQ